HIPGLRPGGLAPGYQHAAPLGLVFFLLLALLLSLSHSHSHCFSLISTHLLARQKGCTPIKDFLWRATNVLIPSRGCGLAALPRATNMPPRWGWFSFYFLLSYFLTLTLTLTLFLPDLNSPPCAPEKMYPDQRFPVARD
ncbi:MAG TPA: hypothetical protein VF191_15130, partial [Cyclobacteriaceae bacterium]